MLRSDWLNYYYAICYSPLEAKSAGFENQNNGGWAGFCEIKLFCLDILTNYLDFTKTIISLALMASESIAESRMGYWLRAHLGSRNNCLLLKQEIESF